MLLVFSMMVSMVGCSKEEPKPDPVLDPNPKVITEKVEIENTIIEKSLTEFITTEIYLEEFIEAEEKIRELLLEENQISEVSVCRSVYVPQGNLEEFAENSQTSHVFGDGVNIKSVLTKVAVGTGVIVTLIILKKVGLPNSVAEIIVSAADESLKFGATGAAAGSVLGALTGAVNEIDESGRIMAVTGFALAVAGLVVSIVSLIGTIPSGGTTAIGVAEGIHLAIAGVKVVATGVATVKTATNCVKTFTSTDGIDIDWDNVDWDKVGVSAAEKAINYGTEGYMWGAIYGAVDGADQAYYEKFCTPYTKYKLRLNQTPSKGGHWTGKRGESDFILDEPIKLPDGTTVTKITYKNAVPDFSPYAKAKVNIKNMTNKRYEKGGNFEQANEELAKLWTKSKYNNKTWTARDVENYRTENNLTWHEMSNMEGMQLVPTEINATFTHYGGVAEYNAMIGKEGEMDFD